MEGFANKILSHSQAESIFLFKAQDSTGKNAWYFVNVDSAKQSSFLRLPGKEHYNLADYGEVIESGYGEEPGVHIRQKIDDDYGTNFNAEETPETESSEEDRLW